MSINRVLVNPLLVFSIVWLGVLVFSVLGVSESFYTDYSPLLWLFFLSSVGFYIGYLSSGLVLRSQFVYVRRSQCNKMLVGRRGRGGVFFVMFCSVIIILLNFLMEGLPPFFSFLGHETKNYLEYGRLKGVLFGMVIFLFLISFYFSKGFSLFLKLFCLVVLSLYVSRGLIVFSVLAYLFLVLLEERLSNFKISILLFFSLVFIVFIVGVSGEVRTGTENFYSALEIKDQYRSVNPGVVWIISYVSMPTINIVELTKGGQYFYGQVMLSSALPAFMSFDQGAELFYRGLLPNPYNTVAGYLKNVFLDFGWCGVLIYNFALGVLLFVSSVKFSNLSRSVLLAALFFLFFHDFFISFTTIFVVLLFYLFNRFLVPLSSSCKEYNSY